MLANINYRGTLLTSTKQFDFGTWKPRQFVYKCCEYTIIIFQSGKCRIMGCKKELNHSTLPFQIKVDGIQSLTICANLGQVVDLSKLSRKLGKECIYEPELFPGLRYTKYNPLCVNVFSTGKIVILGIKTMDYVDFVDSVLKNISCFI